MLSMKRMYGGGRHWRGFNNKDDKTQKSIASEVAVDTRSNYGSFRSLKPLEDDNGGGWWWMWGQTAVEDESLSTREVWWWLRQQYQSEGTVSSSVYSSAYCEGANTWNSASAAADTEFQRANISATYLNAATGTPMGSTTRLITADATSSSVKGGCCSSRCWPVFGTLFMTISLAFSLANLLRLPAIVFAHGGATFLVAYVIVAVTFGMPLIFLEITLGQFCQQGATKLWRAVPLFKGVGVLKMCLCAAVSVYYSALASGVTSYAVWSVIHPMPSSQCTSPMLPSYIQNTTVIVQDTIRNSEICSRNENIGMVYSNWLSYEMAALIGVWILIILAVCKNGSSYKVACGLLTPIAIFLLITTCAQTFGRSTGSVMKFSKFLIDVKWSNLLQIDVWYAALIQFLLSTHLGLGNITTCAGRLYPKNNPFWTAVVFTLLNVFVGICFTGVCYTWMSDLLSTGNLVRHEPLAQLFTLQLVYDAASNYYSPPYCVYSAIVTYGLLACCALLSVATLLYTICVAVTVESKNKCNWCVITLTLSIICLAAAASILALDGEVSVIKLLDDRVCGAVLITAIALEVAALVFIYGIAALANDFEFVLGYKLALVWKGSWILAPPVFAVLQIWWWLEDSNRMDLTAWIVYGTSWFLVILVAIFKIAFQVDYNLSQKIASSIKATRNWGPVDPIYRHCWLQWRKQYQTTGQNDFTLKRRGTRDYTHSVKRAAKASRATCYSIDPNTPISTLQRSQSSYQTPPSTWNSSPPRNVATNIRSIAR